MAINSPTFLAAPNAILGAVVSGTSLTTIPGPGSNTNTTFYASNPYACITIENTGTSALSNLSFATKSTSQDLVFQTIASGSNITPAGAGAWVITNTANLSNLGASNAGRVVLHLFGCGDVQVQAACTATTTLNIKAVFSDT